MARKPARPTNNEIEAYFRFPSGLRTQRLGVTERWIRWCRANGRDSHGKLLKHPKASAEGHSMDVFLRAQIAGSRRLDQGPGREIAQGIRLRLPKR